MGARGQQHHDGIGNPGGGHAAQVVQQHVRIVIDRRHAMRGEQIRKQPHHHFAVFEHVGDAGGHAQVVFQHFELARVIAHDVDAGDVGVNVAGDIHSLHLRTVLRVAQHLFRWNHACLQNLLIVVNVMNEGIQGSHALLQARIQPDPFLVRQHARHDIEGDEAFRAFLLAVDREGDAYPVKQRIGFCPLLGQKLQRLAFEPSGIALIVRPAGALFQVHLVVRRIAQGVSFQGCPAQLQAPAAPSCNKDPRAAMPWQKPRPPLKRGRLPQVLVQRRGHGHARIAGKTGRKVREQDLRQPRVTAAACSQLGNAQGIRRRLGAKRRIQA